MKRIAYWTLSYKRWIVLVVYTVPLLLWAGWALSFRTVAVFVFAIIWVIHLALGFGAGYAALRLWYSRHYPLIKWMGLYINAFIVDVLSAIVLLFVARGVILTWKFTTVMFVSTFISDLIRAPLIFYLIKGQAPLPPTPTGKTIEEPPPRLLDEFRQIMREEIEANERRRER